ncbi:MAG: beta-galactosidase, partial [Spirochaetaceae bacterium]
AQIVRLELGVMPCHAGQTVEITNLRMTDVEPAYPVPEVKLVDEIGQYTKRDWPGKTKSVDDMVRYMTTERDAAREISAAFPERNAYGGWTGEKLDATGFFRTHHDGKRWWLIDPDGAPFFSTGPDCVRPEIECPVEGIEKLFTWLPPKDGEYAEAWSVRPHHNVRFFDFGIANLIRAFGSAWRETWETMTAYRLREWGFNTIANWSDRGITKTAGIPYVWPLVNFPTTSKTIFRDFPDVFSDEFGANADAFAAQLAEFVGDPLMIGYFLRNEPTWAFVHGLIIAEEVLATDAAPASRKALAAFLSEKYSGDVAGINAAWNIDLTSFGDLETRIVPHACRLSQAANDDLIAFSRIMIRRYVEVPSVACRKVDPDHLNLGMRYAYVASDLLLEGSDCFDVFSINCYQMDPTDHIDAVGKAVGLPIMIGEYHFGALDRGLVANALRGVATQKDRGIGYRYYLERAAANPYCVGAHYFTVADEATLGRYDGENWNIGVEDVCRRPYREFLDGIIETHKNLYEVASGRKQPTDEQAVETPRNAF